MWLPGGATVLWLRQDGTLHTMGADGAQAQASLRLSNRPRGALLSGDHVLVYSDREIVNVLLADPGAPRRLVAAPLNLALRVVALGAREEELLVADGPAILHWTEDAGFRDLRAPTADVLGYCAVLAVPGTTRVLALARTSTGRADRIVALQPDLGDATWRDVDGDIAQLDCLPAASLLAVLDGRLVRLAPDAEPPAYLTDPGVRVHAFALSPDRMRALLALSGAHDTNGDGRRSPDDPANLYVLDLPRL